MMRFYDLGQIRIFIDFFEIQVVLNSRCESHSDPFIELVLVRFCLFCFDEHGHFFRTRGEKFL